MFEQIRLANIYVHYSDVQFSKGSFVNRVQIKTAQGRRWLTVPISGRSLKNTIREIRINYTTDWRRSHLSLLRQAYANTPCKDDMLRLVESVYDEKPETIEKLSKLSLSAACAYLTIGTNCKFLDIEDLNITGRGSARVLEVVRYLEADTYLTGLGARQYLDHDRFDDAGVRIEYMDYRNIPYPQQHGEFTPYVSVLDLIANSGRDGKKYISPRTVFWKDYVSHDRR